jgi:transposase
MSACGTPLVEDLAGYRLLMDGPITEAACWAHAWLAFFEWHAAIKSQIAELARNRSGNAMKWSGSL